MSLVLGIDLGTQHLKVLVYESDARDVVGLASTPLDIHQEKDGTAEQQASWWTDALLEAMAHI